MNDKINIITPYIFMLCSSVLQLATTVRVWQVGHFGAQTYHHAQAVAFVLGFNLIISNSRSKSFGGVYFLH
jgi:hypothetical protein